MTATAQRRMRGGGGRNCVAAHGGEITSQMSNVVDGFLLRADSHVAVAFEAGRYAA